MFERWLDIPQNKSCLVLGPRRCGKTTLLRHRYPDLKYAVDNENARFLMTGSSNLGLLDAVADTLAGRIDILALPTLCWGESHGQPTHSIFDKDAGISEIKTAQRSLYAAHFYGLFPEIVKQEKDSDRKDLLQNYKNTYFTRDLMQLSNIENLDGLLGIFHNIARSIGSHLEISNFARESGLSHQTTRKYLNALTRAQLTFKLHGFQYGPAKRYLKTSKTYFADNSILSSLNVDVALGQRMENFVISELEKRRKLGFLPVDNLYFYKSAAGHEIDLIFEMDGCLHVCEIKATERPGPKAFRNLRNFTDQLKRPLKRFLFYLGDEYQNKNDITLIPIAALFRGR